MKTEFLDTIKKYGMLDKGQRICVAVSGGADSMCLLSLLDSVKHELGIEIFAAHVNHCIRGDESDNDEEFVRNYCDKIGVDCVVKRIDVPYEASVCGESTELCARRLRYEFFSRLDADIIATAHTGSDRVETLLMNLARGAALDGLCSIPPVRGNIIRPLIGFTRADIENYCEKNRIPYVIDSTNLTTDYTRNKFRHEIVTRLTQIYPAFENNALRCLELINEDNSELDAFADCLTGSAITSDNSLLCSALKDLSDTMRRRVIVKFLNKNNIYDYAYKHISFLNENFRFNFALTLPSGIRIAGDSVRVYLAEAKNSDNFVRCDTYEFSKYDEVIYHTSDCTFKIYKSETVSDAEQNKISYVDFEKVGDILRFRSREQGDIIHLGKRKCTKTLKKLFNEMKIPADKRDAIAVLSDENGLIYVENVGIDARRSGDNNTKMYLIIEKKGC